MPVVVVCSFFFFSNFSVLFGSLLDSFRCFMCDFLGRISGVSGFMDDAIMQFVGAFE